MGALENILEDYGIDFIDQGQNSSREFINIQCENVGCCENDTKYKRGIHRSMTYTNCWAGDHPIHIQELVKSLGIPWNVWYQGIKDEEDDWDNIKKKEYKDSDEFKGIIIPGEELSTPHKDYLISRGLSPDFLIKHFKLKGYTYEAENWKLKYRLIIPIYKDNLPISYIGRSYLKDSENRYMCCLPEEESYFHKFSFFNIDKATNDKVLLVEGTFDVFKLVYASNNFNVIASYGTQILDEQLTLLRRRFKVVYILYDNEEKAQNKAMKIVNYLKSYGVEATSIVLNEFNDPGEMDLETAKYLVKGLLE